MVLIQAAGRVLSQKNVDKLRAAFVDIGKILIASGTVAPSDLGSLFKGASDASEEDQSNSEVVQAGCLKDDFKINSWQNNLKEALRLFEYRSHDIFLNMNSDEYLNRRYGEGKILDKKTFAKELVSELGEILTDIFDNLPSSPESDAFIPPHYTPLPVSVHAEGATEPEVDAIEAQAIPEAAPAADDNILEIVPDVKIDLELVFERGIEVLAAEKRGKGKQSKSANNRPIRGVLFRIDEPSETAPSKGSDYPLFIPKAVAEDALVAINASKGLPLDADSSLAKHANKEIVGVMVAAEIQEQDFIVQGHLFHWNQQDRVEAISTNQELLGMSLNAHASGAVAHIEGRDVFCLSHLDILGANILLKDRATYQKTRLIPTEIAASSASVEPSENVTPSENVEQQLKTEEIDMEPLEQRIKELQTTLAEISASSAKDSEKAERQISDLTAIVNKQSQLINAIEAERQQTQQLVQAQAAEQEKAKDMQALISALGQQIDQTLEARLAAQKEELQKDLLDAINPKRVPPRITQPLVGIAAEGQQQQQSNIQRERLIAAQSALATMEQHGITGTARIGLVEELKELRASLSNSYQ